MSDVQAEVKEVVEQPAVEQSGQGTGTEAVAEPAATPVAEAAEPAQETAQEPAPDAYTQAVAENVEAAAKVGGHLEAIDGHLASIEAIALTWGGDVGIMLRNIVGKIRSAL